jgi:penicillin-binding protein 1A
VAVARGTGNSARLPGIKAYGKTGTTQNFRDALFVGFAGDLIVGVWFGNDDNSPMNGVTGRGLPAETWRKFMMQALPQLRARPVAAARAEREADAEALDPAGEAAAAAAAIEQIMGDAAAGSVTPEQAIDAINRAAEAGDALRQQIENAAEEAARATAEPQPE